MTGKRAGLLALGKAAIRGLFRRARRRSEADLRE